MPHREPHKKKTNLQIAIKQQLHNFSAIYQSSTDVIDLNEKVLLWIWEENVIVLMVGYAYFALFMLL